MTNARRQRWEAPIGQALEAGLAGVQPAPPGAWRIEPPGGEPFRGQAHIPDGWLLVAVRPATGRAEPRRMLELNAALGGGAKLVLERDGEVGLRAEIPLLEDLDVAVRVRQCCEGLNAAAGLLAGDPFAGPPEAGDETDGGPDLAALCEEAGWPTEERSGGLSVKLDVAERPSRATVAAAPGGAVRLWTALDLGDWEGWPPDCRSALERMLLAAGRIVRMARPALGPEGRKVGFMVAFDSQPAAGEIGHALSALSVARRLCGREAGVLCDQGIAGLYVATGSPAPRPQDVTR